METLLQHGVRCRLPIEIWFTLSFCFYGAATMRLGKSYARVHAVQRWCGDRRFGVSGKQAWECSQREQKAWKYVSRSPIILVGLRSRSPIPFLGLRLRLRQNDRTPGTPTPTPTPTPKPWVEHTVYVYVGYMQRNLHALGLYERTFAHITECNLHSSLRDLNFSFLKKNTCH